MGSEPPIFVVHRHDARNLHYDLRLEVDGALASWAVPKGPSLDPAVKRLAVQVEDHDLGYADFEGAIGEGPGHGTVVVWDTGVFANVTQRRGRPIPAGEAVRRGHLKFVLRGHRLTGAFALTRTKLGGEDRNWLLVKVNDEFADRERDVLADATSVVTGRTNEDFEAE